MPSIDIDSIDFEVICGTCGAGLCNNTNIRYSNNRKMPQVVVEVCEDCLQKKQDEITDLQQEVNELEKEIDDLKKTIDSLGY